jgi:LysR family transcriptional regulator, hydrogen peroxide-inducible genes activator
MEMHQIRYFLALCDTLNFTRAAEQCNVTQPALSRAVQALEEEVGAPLFRRERSLTHLTDLGRLLRPHLTEILQETEAVKTTARSFLKLDNAGLNVGIMCTIGPLQFMGFLAKFRLDQPGIELSMREAPAQTLADLLQSGAIDVAVMAQPEALPERFDVHSLYKEGFVVAFPPGHRFAQLNAVPLKEVNGENYLRRLNCEYRNQIGDTCRANGFSLKVVYASEREDWIQTMVLAGLGLCFMPEYSVAVPGLMSRPVIDPRIEREISLVTVAGRRFSPAAAKFVAAVRAHQWPGAAARIDAPEATSAAPKRPRAAGGGATRR